VDRLPHDTKINSDYFVTKSLISFEQAVFPPGTELHQKYHVVHLDNCSLHTRRASTVWLEENGMHCRPHPRYSFDLVPGDFSLFPTVKEKLERIQVADEHQFLSADKRF
jgi:hypothetical protein